MKGLAYMKPGTGQRVVNKMNYLNKFLYTLSCLVIAVASVAVVYQNDTYAANCDISFYNNNDILFYNPCESTCSIDGGSLTGPTPTKLSGESNSEKTWNYFIERGLSPIAAAGAMGNIQHESGFNPWIGESGSTSINPADMGVGFGLIQWTNTGGNTNGRRAGVIKAMEAAGINLSNINQNDQSQTDIALLVQLNWLWDGEYGGMTWQEPLNNETKVDGDTSKNSLSAEANIGNGTTLYFHAAVERSADTPTMLQGRINSANEWLTKFSGAGANGDCGGETTDIVEMAKKVQDGAAGLQRMDGLKGNITGLDCGDCVSFVSTVYVAAGYPKPFAPVIDDEGSGIMSVPGGNSGNLPSPVGYYYDSNNYEIIPNSEKQPGDILAWDGHVAIYAGDNNAYEGGKGPGSNRFNTCNIGGLSWYDIEKALVLKYKGDPIL
jgi:hypothetical protein